MKKQSRNLFIQGLSLIGAFVIWTVLVYTVDVKAIGPLQSRVGFSSLNGYVHGLTGTNMLLYELTDLLGLVPIAIALGFAFLGLIEWIKRGSLLQVDKSILILGVFYGVVIALFLFFEVAVINYRPILIEGKKEASYPSSTTLLSLCVMLSTATQARARIKRPKLRRITLLVIYAFTLFMVIARLLSGVHWFTDIVGGILLSFGLVSIYISLSEL